MKIQDQVCSLELAKDLKQAGIDQNSVFSWAKDEGVFGVTSTAMTELMRARPRHIRRYEATDVYSAFTVSELIAMLPELPEPYRLSFGIENPKADMGGKYYAVYDAADYPHDQYFHDDNMANCLAELLIHMIDGCVMEVPK